MNFKPNSSTVLAFGGMPSMDLPIRLPGVFAVTGEGVLATDLLTIQAALTCSERREPGTMPIITLTGLASIGCLAVVNLIIRSEFGWLIATSALPRAVSVTVYGLERNQS